MYDRTPSFFFLVKLLTLENYFTHTGADEQNKIDCYNNIFEAFLKNYELFRLFQYSSFFDKNDNTSDSVTSKKKKTADIILK